MGAFGRAVYNSDRRYRIQRDEIAPAFARLGGDLAGCRVLEIGAGRGTGAELAISALAAARVDVVDLDPTMTTLAAERLSGRPAAVVRADSAALPLADGSYDAVIDLGGIHLADDWRAILGEIARVLLSGGRFFLEQPTNPVPGLTLRPRSGGRVPGGFGRAELTHALAACGLEIVAMSSRGFGGLDLLGVAYKSE